MTARGKSRTKPLSRSSRAGLQFPISRVHRFLRKSVRNRRIGVGAAVFLSAVLEYLTSEVMELAGNVARDNAKVRITPRHVLLAIRGDREMDDLVADCVFPGSGVMPLVTSTISIKNVGTIVKKDVHYRSVV